MTLIERLFLSCGAAKAGTTWLFSVLKQNPDIYFSYEKEIHYFAQIHGLGNALTLTRRLARFKQFASALQPETFVSKTFARRMQWYSRWLSEPLSDEWYADLFRQARGQKYIADFCNLNSLLDDRGWMHVRRVADKCKVIYVMRNPLQRLWSHVKFHAEYIGKVDALQSYDANQMERAARASYLWPHSEYGQVVRTLRRNFNDSEVMFAFYDDIHNDRVNWLRELESFLGVRPGTYDDTLLMRTVNPSRSIQCRAIFLRCSGAILSEYCQNSKQWACLRLGNG